MAVVNKFNVNREQVTLDADIIENMSANDVSYDASTQYDENTVGDKLSELEKEVIYDVTANNDGATFASLSELLSSENLSTLIPTSVRHGGMSIRFVQISDNKYVQFRCTANDFTTEVADWKDDSTIVDNKDFYITDSNGYIIAKIYNGGINSVDFKINGVSVNNLITSAVLAEEERAKIAEDSKLNSIIEESAFYITDNNGYIVFKVDSSGAHAPNLFDGTYNDDNLTITDNNGYIIFKVDANGVHSAKDKHAVTCMVLSESYYPTAAPTMDSDGNVTYAQVMFETGVAGNISITYTNGNSSSVAVVYGNNNYTITINRDSDGNVETVSVN